MPQPEICDYIISQLQIVTTGFINRFSGLVSNIFEFYSFMILKLFQCALLIPFQLQYPHKNVFRLGQ